MIKQLLLTAYYDVVRLVEMGIGQLIKRIQFVAHKVWPNVCCSVKTLLIGKNAIRATNAVS